MLYLVTNTFESGQVDQWIADTNKYLSEKDVYTELNQENAPIDVMESYMMDQDYHSYDAFDSMFDAIKKNVSQEIYRKILWDWFVRNTEIKNV